MASRLHHSFLQVTATVKPNADVARFIFMDLEQQSMNEVRWRLRLLAAGTRE